MNNEKKKSGILGLLRYVGQYKLVAIATPVCAGLEVVMEMLIPFIMASLIDKGINAGNMAEVWKFGGLMLLSAMLSLALGIIAARFAATSSTGFGANLRSAMYAHIQDFSFANIDKFSTAGLITRMTTDVMNIQNAFQMSSRMAIRAPLTFISSIVMCFVISPEMSMVFMVALVILAVILFTLIYFISGRFTRVFKHYDVLNASVQENISAIRVVKAFVREDHEKGKFNTAASTLAKMFIDAEGLIALNMPVMMTIIYACIILLSWLGAQNIVIGTLTTGELTSLFSYVMSSLGSLMMLSMIFVMLTMSMASGRRIAEVLEETPSITDPENAVKEVADGSIDFDHVSFSYRTGTGEDTLKDIDLHIASGECIGIIGGTGCGKSSLVNLISRLYDVKTGSVHVGGRDVREYDVESLRNNVAVVLQKNVLFSGTLRENLCWGDASATDEAMYNALESACAMEFVSKLPDGLDSRVEQGGTNFSGGQKQRLCIARALLKHPKVLILDDSTSAVDTATDAKIRQAFREKVPGMTRLIIAQRISSVMDADRIIVMENGEIAAFDTHENLLQTSDIYREIYETQTEGGGDFDEHAQGGEAHE